MNYLHTIIDFFANGKSNMKVYLFFLFSIFLLLTNIKFKSKNYNTQKIKGVIIILLITLYTFNLGSFVYFFKSNQIPLFSNIYVFNNKEVSSSNVLHNHTLKSPIGFLLEKIGINPVQEYVDTGYAYTNFFSPIFLYMILILVFLLIFSFFIYVKSEKLSKLQTFIFSIVSFSILKNIFDGGLFHIESILSVSLLLIILKNKHNYERKNQQQNLLIFLIYLCVAIILAFASDQFLPLHGINFMTEFIQKFFFFLMLAVIYYRKQIKKKFILISLIPIFLIISVKYFLQNIYQYESNLTVIYPSQEIFGYLPKPIPDIIKKETFIDLKNSAIVSGYLTNHISRKNLEKELGINDLFHTVKIKDVDCDTSYIETRNFYTRLNETNIDISNVLFKLQKNKKRLIINESSSCLYVNQSILKDIFYDNNIDKIILIQHE